MLLMVLCFLAVMHGVAAVATARSAAGSSWLQHHSSHVAGRALPELLLSSLATSNQPLHRQARRLLQQGGKTQVPQCVWSDVREVCAPSQLVYLSLKAKPVTIFHRVAAQAYDRNLACNGHANEAVCNKDRPNRCMYWNKSCVGMDAYELVNWIGGDQLTGDATAAGFTCKGTDAAIYRECKTAGDAGPKGPCRQLPACEYVDLVEECLPASYNSRTIKQLQASMDAFAAVNTTSWGSCSGACYVRQAAVCDGLSNSSASNSSALCKSKAFCVRDTDPYGGKNTCMHKDTAAQATDEYSKEYAKIKDACFKSKTQLDCETPKVVPVNVGAFRSSTELDKLAATSLAACPL